MIGQCRRLRCSRYVSRIEAIEFEIVIQLGANLAVAWKYRQRLLTVARGAFSEKAVQKFIRNLLSLTPGRFYPASALRLCAGQLRLDH